MRRIIAGVASGIVGVSTYLFLIVFDLVDWFDFLSREEEALGIAGALTLFTYGAIDWLGLLPPPFEQRTGTLLQRDDRSGRADRPD